MGNLNSEIRFEGSLTLGNRPDAPRWRLMVGCRLALSSYAAVVVFGKELIG